MVNPTKSNKAFAEVIQSSLDSYLAQSWTWDAFPIFGSLLQVTSKTETILGCVTSITTGSMDPLRYPFPYQKTEDELKNEQPQIFEFLKTTFSVNVLGYRDTKIHYTLPPTPAKIHAFVELAPTSLAIDFFSNPDFLYMLFSSQSTISHFDDLLLAIFRQLFSKKKLTEKMMESFCNKFSLLTGNDYRRMKLFLQRVEHTPGH